MTALTARDLLDVVDRGSGLDWIARGLLLTSLAWPESTAGDRAALPLGVRDRLLLALRIATYGRHLDLRTRCRNCGAELEASLDLGALLTQYRDEPPASVTIEIDGESLQVRLPSSEDLIATAALDAGQAEWEILARCAPDGSSFDAARLRPVVAEALAAADPLSSLELDLHCATCRASFTEIFDIVVCFWSEIEAGAQRAAIEVHTLASAYGWSERQILAMTPGRRRLYLKLASP